MPNGEVGVTPVAPPEVITSPVLEMVVSPGKAVSAIALPADMTPAVPAPITALFNAAPTSPPDAMNPEVAPPAADPAILPAVSPNDEATSDPTALLT